MAQPALLSLLHAADEAHATVEGKLGTVGLSLPKLAALRKLVEAGGSLPLGQLAEQLSCVKSNVTQLVDRLETDGFVTRAEGPDDRRSRLAVITAAGRKVSDSGMRIQQEAEKEILSGLTAEETRQLAVLVSKLSTRTR